MYYLCLFSVRRFEERDATSPRGVGVCSRHQQAEPTLPYPDEIAGTQDRGRGQYYYYLTITLVKQIFFHININSQHVYFLLFAG